MIAALRGLSHSVGHADRRLRKLDWEPVAGYSLSSKKSSSTDFS